MSGKINEWIYYTMELRIAQNEATSSGTFMHDARVIWNEIASQAAKQ